MSIPGLKLKLVMIQTADFRSRLKHDSLFYNRLSAAIQSTLNLEPMGIC